MVDSSIGDRIGKILSHYGLKSGELAERIGVKAGTMSHFMSGRNKPSFDGLARLLESFPSLSPDWVIHGMGEIERSDGHMLEGTNQMTEQNVAVQGQSAMLDNSQSTSSSNELTQNAAGEGRATNPANKPGQESHSFTISKAGTVEATNPIKSTLFPSARRERVGLNSFTNVNNPSPSVARECSRVVSPMASPQNGGPQDLFTFVNSMNSGFGEHPEAHVTAVDVADGEKPKPFSAENPKTKVARIPVPRAGYHNYGGIRGEVGRMCPHACAAEEGYEVPLGTPESKTIANGRVHQRLGAKENSHRGSNSANKSTIGRESCGTSDMRSAKAATTTPSSKGIDLFTDVNQRMAAFSDLSRRSAGAFAWKLHTNCARPINCDVHSRSQPDTNTMYKNGKIPIHQAQRGYTGVETNAQAKVDYCIADCAEIILLLPEGQYLRFTPTKGASD